MKNLILHPAIENKIFVIRGQKVMLSNHLAKLYGVKTSALNQAVRRNIDRFPADFMFSLSRSEIMNLSQFVISSICRPARIAPRHPLATCSQQNFGVDRGSGVFHDPLSRTNRKQFQLYFRNREVQEVGHYLSC